MNKPETFIPIPDTTSVLVKEIDYWKQQLASSYYINNKSYSKVIGHVKPTVNSTETTLESIKK